MRERQLGKSVRASRSRSDDIIIHSQQTPLNLPPPPPFRSLKDGETLTFYDSVYNTPLFTAPVGRSKDDFLQESYKHGWPSFRDAEVNWDYVRVLKSTGETVSVGGTHLGHNLPDRKGARYCINLVSVAGSKQA